MATVLLVQEASDERTRLCMAVQVCGHQVFEASSAAGGAAALESIRPDVAVIDEELPDAHATEAILLLRKVPGYECLPVVIVLPQCAEDAARVQSDETPMPEVPAVYWICRPVSGGDVETALERALADAHGRTTRHIKLEQRRALWADVSALQDAARAQT